MRRLPIVVFALAALAIPAAALSNGYSFRRAITVSAAVVPSTQTNFPMLVSGTYSYLATVAHGGIVKNTVALNGQTVPADLIFTSDAAGLTLLNWEVASYTAGTGLLEAWVQVPSLSNGSVIYMFYGKAATTTYQGNATSVWDVNYKGVFHLPNGVTLTANDSTANVNTGSATAVTAITGQVNGAGSWNATTSFIDVGTGSSLANLFAAGGTVEAWIDPNSGGQSSNGRILNKTASGDTTPAAGWIFQLTGATPVLKLGVGFSASMGGWTSPAASVPLGAWAHVAATYDGSSAGNVPSLYINGSRVTITTLSPPSGTIAGDATLHMAIGNLINQVRTFDGGLDELKLSNTIRAADWIKAEYNNQSNPSGFYTIGPGTLLVASGTATTAIIM